MKQNAHNNWSNEYKKFNQKMFELDATPSISLSDKNGMSMLAHASFNEFEGTFEAAPFVMLNLCTRHIGKMQRIGDGPSLEGIIRPGTFTLALPETFAQGYTSKTEMLGIAIQLDTFNHNTGNCYTADDFIPAASQFHNDVYISSMMNALWQNAEFHGLSNLFFEQGISFIFNHLSNMKCKRPLLKASQPLSHQQLKIVYDFIESRLSTDINIAELATLTGRSARSFTQAFSTATGYTPYVYFTLRRMEYAKELLSKKTLNVTEVAMSIGYANPSKFSAAFRRVVGITPKEWQKNSTK